MSSAVELLFSFSSPQAFSAGPMIDGILSDIEAGDVQPENVSIEELGLRVSVQLISSLGGKLWVKRTPDRPDEICFTSHFEIAGTSTRDVSLKQTQLGLIPDLPVLVVHAANEQRQQIEDMLFRWQTDPVCVESADEMWKSLEKERVSGVPFALIIIDSHVSDVDGFELCADLKSNQFHTAIPVIMLTDVDHPGEGIKASRAGAATHIVKPFRSSMLARAIMSSVLGKGRYRQLRKDLGAAEMYVRSLIPPPIEEPISIDWRYVPAADLAGDTLGFHWIDDDSCAFYIIDVTGHGMDASLLSVSVLNVLKSMALPQTDFHDPDQVLSRLNEKFPMDAHGDRCFTAWYGVYRRSQNQLVWSGGGHPPAVLVNEDGERRESVLLESNGPLVGMLPVAEFPSTSRQVVPGDRLYIFSDGVFEIEITAGQYAEFDDFVGFLRDYSEEGRSTLDELWERARTLHGNDVLDDDFTILEVRF